MNLHSQDRSLSTHKERSTLDGNTNSQHRRTSSKIRSASHKLGNSFGHIAISITLIAITTAVALLAIQFSQNLSLISKAPQAAQAIILLCSILAILNCSANRKYRKEIERLRDLVEAGNKAAKIKASQMRALTDDSPVPMFILTPSGQCCYANQSFANLTQSTIKSVSDQGWKDFFSKVESNQVLHAWNHSRDEKQAIKVDVDIKSGKESYSPVTVKMTPSLYEDSYVCTIVYIFEREGLRMSSPEVLTSSPGNPVAKQETSSHIAQLRKRLSFPLTRLSRSLQRIAECCEKNSELDLAIHPIQLDAKQMADILDDSSPSRIVMKPENASLGILNPIELAKSIEQEVQAWAINAHIAVGLDIDEHLPQFISGSQSKIREILLLLLEHSTSHTTRGGVKMGFTYLQSEGQLCIEMIDTSNGLSAEHLAQLQSGDDTTHSEQNSLSIACALIRKLGGVFDIESVPRRGVVVQVLIPASISNARIESTPPQSLEPQSMVIKKSAKDATKVLIVGQDSSERTLIGDLLSDIGVYSTKMEDFREALNGIASEEFQLVILNSDISDKVAGRFSRLVREQVGSVPVIAIKNSGNFRPESADGDELYDEILGEPIESEKFYATIVRLLGS